MKSNTRYFKVSMDTLRTLAKETRDFWTVAGFLVLARHASGESIDGHLPYTFTGAGANSIKTKVGGMADAKSNNILQALTDRKLLEPAKLSPKHSRVARYRVHQGQLDLDLPQAIVDGLPNTESPLHRIRGCTTVVSGHDNLRELSANDFRLDALMLLLELYASLSMSKNGGFDPRVLHRIWEEPNIRVKEGNYQWLSNPGNYSSYTHQVHRILAHTFIGKKPPENISARFWNAESQLKRAGLFYEVVTMFDSNPATNPTASAICALRVNDFHAGAERGDAPNDPSLLANLDSTLGYYTPEANDRGEMEQIKFPWSTKQGFLVGIVRPRYRAATKDAGEWIEMESQRCRAFAEQIYSRRQPVEVDDDDRPF